MYNVKIHERIDALRSSMRTNNIDFYLITTADYHNSEYVSDYFKAREYFSGFSGSNGDLLVWKDGAALWTDGRYFLQAEDELEGTGISLMKMGERGVPSVEEFIEKNMLPGQKFGTDGRCIPISRGDRISEALKIVNSKACADAENPEDSEFIWDIDLGALIWKSRPSLPASEIRFLDAASVGESRPERITRVREKMVEEGAECMVLSSLDDIAWLLLMRGNDIAYNPVALSYLIIFQDRFRLYVNDGVLSSEDTYMLEGEGGIIKNYDSIGNDLRQIREELAPSDKIMVDPDRLSYALYMSLKERLGSGIVLKQSPTVLFKAVKTEKEIENERQAHIKDGVAVTKFLYKLHCIREDEKFKSSEVKITELDACDMLLKLRMEQEGFLDQSFAPIIATGSHGAIIHYEPDERSNAVIEKDAFLLMDTGGQYNQGTTDITRTMVMGEATEEMKENFTAVLCGNLELANAYFPEGTTGTNLDILARKQLWKLGLDYRHGTGHGVGYILNVHEGPQNISRRGRLGKMGAPFEHGMITSDEPGVYLPGKYGIRLENMMVCLKRDTTDYGDFFGFETLTVVPFDRRSIAPEKMSEYAKKLLNKYNSIVYKVLAEYLTEEECEWLKEETAPFT